MCIIYVDKILDIISWSEFFLSCSTVGIPFALNEQYLGSISSPGEKHHSNEESHSMVSFEVGMVVRR